MNHELWELVLVDSKGRTLARVLELASKERAEYLAKQWNKDRYLVLEGEWQASRMEGMVVQ